VKRRLDDGTTCVPKWRNSFIASGRNPDPITYFCLTSALTSLSAINRCASATTRLLPHSAMRRTSSSRSGTGKPLMCPTTSSPCVAINTSGLRSRANGLSSNCQRQRASSCSALHEPKNWRHSASRPVRCSGR
jgi:hypothetical protein